MIPCLGPTGKMFHIKALGLLSRKSFSFSFFDSVPWSSPTDKLTKNPFSSAPFFHDQKLGTWNQVRRWAVHPSALQRHHGSEIGPSQPLMIGSRPWTLGIVCVPRLIFMPC